MRRATRPSIRRRLLALVLLPLLGVLPILVAILLWWGDRAIDELLTTKVRSDLAVANGYFDRVMAEVGTGATTVAESHGLRQALASPDPTAVQRLLASYRARSGLSFLVWRAPDGRPLMADWGPVDPDPAHPTPGWPEDAVGLPDDAIAAPGIALTGRDRRVHVMIMEGRALARLAPHERDRIAVPILPTQGARPSAREVEDRAMVLVAASPVRDDQGRLRGHVQAGVLLNRNLEFIDRINEIVYPRGSLPFGSQGTATLFLEDVRISTNVRLFAAGTDERAIGTRVSDSVREAVLDRGRTWLDRAFVVNEWYVSAYEPLIDHRGQRVGMLYVGFLEQPFTLLKWLALAGVGVTFLAVMAAAAWLSLRVARGIFMPVERMEWTMRRVEGGDMDARVGSLPLADELGRLAQGLDHLLDVIVDKTRALQQWNAVLDARVAERTAELQAAQRQLVRSEKLAVIGQLTAGMAHEINNPIAVIQGNLDVLRQALGAQATAVLPELRLIDQQIERMRLIVTQMLQFARPGEFAGYVESVDPQAVVQDSLVLTDHTLRQRGVRVERPGAANLRAAINRQELQQVLVNLIMNAAHAMPNGGTVTLSCSARTLEDGSPGVVIAVADQGPGLPDSVRDGLFQPFVTHKKDGTGLGLWISRSIVERYGGDIRARNRRADEGGGAEFTVWLRSEPHATTG